MAAEDFENVRVEAQQFRTATVRWSYDGAEVTVSLYRSTDGSSYSLVTSSIDPDDGSYVDTGLADETQYYYKLSDDGGSTFSSAVFVVTYVSLKGRVVNATGFNLAVTQRGQSAYESTRDMVEGHARNADSENPCIICSFNQALVVNCSTDCQAFRVVLTEDINSISLVGCDLYSCPTIEFITPPDESYGVCGWPVGWCDFGGDECFESPTAGGDIGSSSWSNGINFPSPGGDGDQDPQCPCPPVLNLSIQCCQDDCELECSE